METIKFENVSFRYPNSDDNALNNISFSAESGELVLICGRSGSGKSTLLKLIKRHIAPFGNMTGNIFLFGKDQKELSERDCVSKIGFVGQSCDGQIVTESVKRELAFGLESLGLKSETIRRRSAETSMYFGIDKLYRRETASLSGGEKQLVRLASSCVCEPSVLLLDEPTAQLDPIAAANLLSYIIRLNRELGITVLISEHHTDGLFSFADRVLCLENGELTVNDTPKNAANNKDFFYGSLPTPAKVYRSLDTNKTIPCPLTTSQCRNYINDNFMSSNTAINEFSINKSKTAVKIRDGYFKYPESSQYVLSGMSLDVYEGEILAVLGSNGAGKSTLLRVISGIEKLDTGKMLISKKGERKKKRLTCAMLPQDPRDLFLFDSVYEDIITTAKSIYQKGDAELRAREVCSLFEIEDLLQRHPYDLSGGERQKAALAKLFLVSPDIILLDEPTKGMDFDAVAKAVEIIKKLKSSGKTVIIATHDTQTAALCADRCALLFDGSIVSSDIPQRFFYELAHYTTPQAHISRDIVPYAVTTQQIKGALSKK